MAILTEYNIGDVIDSKFEVLAFLGRGGCGVVYHVFSRELEEILALKTFYRSSLKERFKKEAYAWINLDNHPNVVNARFYDELNGIPIIVMEYVEPSAEGLLTLDDYINHSDVEIDEYLKWSIQFCDGMEHAYKKGVVCHRDIKPSNLFIDNNSDLKISDFGLAKIRGEHEIIDLSGSSQPQQFIETDVGSGFGTPAYMPPEQFVDATQCDQRSDIYSFGIVLYQIASGGKLPFEANNPGNNFQILKYLHSEVQVPNIDSPLSPIIRKCLSKAASDRFNSIQELRASLVDLVQLISKNNLIATPNITVTTEDIWEIREKGLSLQRLGRNEEAIACFDKFLKTFPDSNTLFAKANSLQNINRHNEAIELYSNLLNSDPCNVDILNNMSISFMAIGNYDQAVKCCDQAFEIAPNSENSLITKGNIFYRQKQYLQSVGCYKYAYDINNANTACLRKIGLCYSNLADYNTATSWYDKAVKSEPLNDQLWEEAAIAHHNDKSYDKAIAYYNEALTINPRRIISMINKSKALYVLSKIDEAISCLKKCLSISPENVEAVYNLALYYDVLQDYRNTIDAFSNVIKIFGDNNDKRKVYAEQRLRELTQ